MNNFFHKKLGAFHWAAIKLSIFYVLIVMIISIAFSIGLYNISTNEVGRGIGKTFRVVNQCAPSKLPPGFEDLEHVRLAQLDEISNNLQTNLIYFNLIILAISSALSYFLAKKTLHPLEEAMESQKRFTADASHELRTPLAAMRAEIDVTLRDKKITISEARKLLESNIEEISKLENLSATLLKLARYQDGKIEMKDLNIAEVIIEAYQKIQPLADKKKIEFVNELKELHVKGDKQSLVELFIILLDNAVKYSHSGQKIEINIFKHAKNVGIKIKDYGLGINEADLPHIFDRFYRADSSRGKNHIDGFGLGLSLAKQIVDLHDGEISVKSTHGEGSEFSVLLSESIS